MRVCKVCREQDVRNFIGLAVKEFWLARSKKMNNALALAVGCGRLAPIGAPLS